MRKRAASSRQKAPRGEDSGKSIILFSDGNGNSSAKLFKTNVWRMYEAVDLGPASPGKRKQVAFYDDGVGTSALRPLAMLGGVFGFGLKRNILEIYRYACRNYTPATGEVSGRPGQEGSDDIFAFGFSRGAFTIRLVVALIASQGLVPAQDERELRRRSADAYRAFRSSFLPRRLKAPTRLWRKSIDLLRRRFRRARGVEPYDPRRNYRPTIRFVGVWDTVAAYGGPIVEITRGIDNWLYALSMPDYCLHRDVRCARHALAIDDERDAFHPLLWDEVHEGTLIEEKAVSKDRLRQVWFTGMHADVGGGYPDESLSYVSFLWMLSEAQAAGLRSLDAVTDRYRALANSAGPMHDSRSGFGAYYRYQPRNIGAWLHPPVTESIVQDPDLRGEDGLPQGLLTRVQLHESVIARISNGTDGYAPFTLPASIEVVPPHARGENAPQADSETLEAPSIKEQRVTPLVQPQVRARVEDRTNGEMRAAAMAAVWDLVWYRRVYYFATLLLTLALLAMPVWVSEAPEAPVLADGRNWAGSLIRLVAVATPDFLDPAIESMAENSFYFLLLVIAIVLLMRRSKATELRLRDRTRAIWWRALGGQKLPLSSPSFLQRVRTSRLYRRPLRLLKWKILPTASAAVFVLLGAWILLGAYAQLRLVGLERGEVLCRRSDAAAALTVEQVAFSPASPCQSVRASVRKGDRYIVDLAVVEPWRDGSIAASPAGLAAGDLGLAGYAAIPFRRVITANYLQPTIEIRRGPGGLGGDDRVHIEALDFSQQGDRPNTWRAEFEAARSGELLIFANEAVLPFRAGGSAADYLYRSPAYGNHGSACLTIRRANLAGASARPTPEPACVAAARTSGTVSTGPALRPAPVPADRLERRGTSEGAPAAADAADGRIPPTAILVLQDILRFFATFVAAALAVGLIVAALLNLLRPFVRVLYQVWGIRRWVSSRARRSPLPILDMLPDWFVASLGDAGKERLFQAIGEASASVHRLGAKAHRLFSPRLLAATGIRTRPGLLADDLFMHSVEVEARSALTQPSGNPKLFFMLSADAPADARALMLGVDLLARVEPAEAYKLIEPVDAAEAPASASARAGPVTADPVQSPSDAAIGAAEAAVMTAGERALDELQLSLESAGLLFDRLLAVALGIAAALVVTSALERAPAPMLAAVGVAGGLLGLLGNDAFRGLRLAGARSR